jgi:tetratricopeptide (TPR) repeat protein
MRYRAFISYNHKDARWARWLHRSLEGYRTPARLRGSVGEYGLLPDRLLPIFRDRDDLASAGNLSPKIQAALADSEALIVICSPDAARSPWVNEEVRTFKRTGRANRVYCLIVGGEPNAGDAHECFAPALRFELDADGESSARPAEPIAADVRPGTDGKYLARLKLLSGLLGVDLDTLRRREAARRQRRLLAIATLSVFVMIVTTALAVQAVIARHAAERRQKQAEALVAFMLGNLTDKLSQVSRLDVMESVNDKAMDYLQSLPTEDVSEQSLEQRATVLVKIGNVRRDQGHLPEALQSYQSADALSAKLAQAAPADIARQLTYAHTRTYIGTTYWYQGELDRAEENFGVAQVILQRARPLAPENPELLYQLSTINNNVGHVLEGRGRYDQALAQYQSMLALAQRLVQIEPGNRRWGSQAGLGHNNLAKMNLLRGDLATALGEYRADLDIESALARGDPKDNEQAEKVVLSRAALARTLVLTGDVGNGIAQFRQTLDEVARLLTIDADNTSFLEDDGLYSLQLARALRATGDVAGASRLAARGLDIFERLTRKDSANFGWQRALAGACAEQAELARAGKKTGLAREHATRALAILEPQLARRPGDRDTVLATLGARTLLASVADDANRTSGLLGQVLQTTDAQASGRSDPRLLALQIDALLALGRVAEAKAMLPTVWASGFREPHFVALLGARGLGVPAVDAKPARP